MKLTIITINLNNAHGLERTIKSVIDQTFTDFEYLVIDGGSTDGSVDVIRKYAEKITWWISEPDNGIYNAMNKGILRARGEYLQFLNSGDRLTGSGILFPFLESSDNIDIIYGNVNIVSQDSKPTLHLMPKESELTLAYFLQKTITHQAAFIRKDLFRDSLYDESFRIYSDWKFFIQKIILCGCSLRYINRPVVNYDSNGISNRKEDFGLLHAEEKGKILSQIIPSRILTDYEIIVLAGNSTLLKHLPYLNTTRGFQKAVTSLVGFLISIYRLFRKIFKKPAGRQELSKYIFSK